jgi:poly-gamma-glutamate synthesis protein (capsule biosynthesis protein)
LCVIALLCVAAVTLSACDRGERLPPSVRLAADPPLRDRALAAAGELLAASEIAVQLAPDPDAADLIVTSVPATDGAPFVTRYWAAVVPLAHPAETLTMAQLGDAVAGRASDWLELGGDALPLRVLLPDGPALPIEQWWPDVAAQAERASIPEILAALETEPGALAILPVDALDPRARSLAIDAADPVFGTGDLAAYPLVERAWVVAQTENIALARVLDDAGVELAARLSLAPPDPIVLRATGDILPVRCTLAKLLAYGDFRRPFLELGPWLAEAEIAVGSLDAALSDAGVPFQCVETFSLLAPAAAVEGMAYAGFDVITVATNHVKDCGQAACGDQAFFDTLANLRGAGIEPVGGGAGLAEARRPVVLTVQGVRFAFLGYDEIAPYYHAEPGVPGTAPLEEAYLREDVAAAAQQADVVVVLPQWGVEYTADPTITQRTLAAAAVEAGAGLVIGNHPHWVQAAEVIDGAFVAYALGNFVFDQDWSVETQQGVVLEAAFHGARLRGVRYRAVHIVDEHQPVFAEPAEARQILDRIWTASAALE